MNYTQEQRAALDAYKRHHGITQGLDSPTPDNLAGIVAWHRKRTGCAPTSPAKAYGYGDGASPLVGYKFTAAEIEQAIRAATPSKAATDAEFERARAEFRRMQAKRAHASGLDLKVYSMTEVRPSGYWHHGREIPVANDAARLLTDALGLKSTPPVRWIGETAEGVKSDAGWFSIFLPAPSGSQQPWGFFSTQRREVWVKHGLGTRDAATALAHEFRHCWQFDRYGADYFNSKRDEAEADAYRFGEEWADWWMRLVDQYQG